MEAVSPFLRASTIRNLRTDCSRVAPLLSIEVRGGEAWVDWLRARVVDEVEGFELWWLKDACEGGWAMVGKVLEVSVGSEDEETGAWELWA